MEVIKFVNKKRNKQWRPYGKNRTRQADENNQITENFKKEKNW